MYLLNLLISFFIFILAGKLDFLYCFIDTCKLNFPVSLCWRCCFLPFNAITTGSDLFQNSECMDCSCGECCSAYSTPVNFSDDCVKVFDAKACEYIVHKKNDPTMLCPVYGEWIV
uniref:Uncharacterized protein n=1 Tax=Mola mola TaxID=94237 RepID=A0A3Q3W3Q5_MOLML